MEHDDHGCEVAGLEHRHDGLAWKPCGAAVFFDSMCLRHAAENYEEGDVFTAAEAAAFEALVAALPAAPRDVPCPGCGVTFDGAVARVVGEFGYLPDEDEPDAFLLPPKPIVACPHCAAPATVETWHRRAA